jgi:hypothetical protein
MVMLIGTSDAPLNRSVSCSSLLEVMLLFLSRRGATELLFLGLVYWYALKRSVSFHSSRNFLQWFFFSVITSSVSLCDAKG